LFLCDHVNAAFTTHFNESGYWIKEVVMPRPWIPGIKQSKQLTVFPGTGFMQSPIWGGGLFKKILDEFNRLSTVNKLGVTVVASSQKPADNGITGANVQIEISQGIHKFMFEGVEHFAFLPGTRIDIAGVTNSPEIPRQVKAFVFVPANPTVGGADSRGVGEGVKLAIAIHELIHACGLSQEEHTPANNPDVFTTGGSLSARFPPDGVPGDRIQLSNSIFVPPIFLTARTVGLIQSNWK
jgi:hypothetical protein